MKQIIKLACALLLLASCTKKQGPAAHNLESHFLDVPAKNSSAEPFLFSDDSTAYLTWVEKSDSGATLKFSVLENDSWTIPQTIAHGSNWFVNWADYPMLAARGQHLIAHFLDRSGDNKYAYDVKITLSSDQGRTWTSPKILHDDNKKAEHGFVTLLPYGDNFLATWLDGRNTAMEGMENMDHHGHGAMSLRAALLDPAGNKISEWELDDKTCDCCQTTACMTSNGPVVIYRDRSDDEVRDMSIVRLVDNKWTSPVPIHKDGWKISGCPVNGPRVASKGSTLAVAWFSMASDTARVNVKFSRDGGAVFGPLIRIDEGNAIGRVDIDLLDESTALVTWMEGEKIMLATVTSSGEMQETTTLASSSEARSSGFPQLAIIKSQAVIAWTDDAEKKVKTVILRKNQPLQ